MSFGDMVKTISEMADQNTVNKLYEDFFKGLSQEELDANPEYHKNRARIEADSQRRELQRQRREERMRIRPDQSNLVKQWVDGTRDKGRASNLKVNGDVMISYQTPIAIRQDTIIYMVDQRFSVSTSKQQGYIRRETPTDSLVILSVADFKEKLDDMGKHSHGWLQESVNEDFFKGLSQEELEAKPEYQKTLKYKPKTGTFPFKFLRYIENPDKNETSWKVVGLGRAVNYSESAISFYKDTDPEFDILYDIDVIIDNHLTRDDLLTQELSDFDGSAEDWLRFKDWSINLSGYTGYDDPAYDWIDTDYYYTSFEIYDYNTPDYSKDEGVVIKIRGREPVVYAGDYTDMWGATQMGDPEEKLAYLFGYENFKNLVYDIKDYRGTLTDKDREKSRPREPVPGQRYWDLDDPTDDEGNVRQFIESVNEDFFKGPDPEEVEKKKIEKVKQDWNTEARIRQDIVHIINTVKRTGTGYWKVFDLLKTGAKAYVVWKDLEEIRLELAEYHSADWDDEGVGRDAYDETLSTLMNVGSWGIHELTREEVTQAIKDGDIQCD